MSRRSYSFLTVIAGLVLLASTIAPWSKTSVESGTLVGQELVTHGSKLAGELVIVAIIVIILGLLSLLTVKARLGASLAGLIGLGYATAGLVKVFDISEPTEITYNPWLAIVSCLVLVLISFSLASYLFIPKSAKTRQTVGLDKKQAQKTHEKMEQNLADEWDIAAREE